MAMLINMAKTNQDVVKAEEAARFSSEERGLDAIFLAVARAAGWRVLLKPRVGSRRANARIAKGEDQVPR